MNSRGVVGFVIMCSAPIGGWLLECHIASSRPSGGTPDGGEVAVVGVFFVVALILALAGIATPKGRPDYRVDRWVGWGLLWLWLFIGAACFSEAMRTW